MKPYKMLKEVVQRGVEKAFNNSYFTAFTVADLINDDKFMRVVYGEEEVCHACGGSINASFVCPVCDYPAYTRDTPNYQYIQQQAIILEGDEQIKFLHERMER